MYVRMCLCARACMCVCVYAREGARVRACTLDSLCTRFSTVCGELVQLSAWWKVHACMHARTRARARTYTRTPVANVCAYERMYVSMRECVRARVISYRCDVCVCMRARVCVCVCVCMRMHACMYLRHVRVCVCACLRAHTHARAYACARVRIVIRMRVFYV